MTETELRLWLLAITVGVWALLAVISLSMYFGYQDSKTLQPPELPPLPPEKPQRNWKGKKPS